MGVPNIGPTPSGVDVPRFDQITGGGGVTVYSQTIAFTDGDTYRRTTVTNASVSATSKLMCQIERPDTADDSADLGYIYVSNICRVGAGSFDVSVACLGWGFDDPTQRPPNETITLFYTIG